MITTLNPERRLHVALAQRYVTVVCVGVGNIVVDLDWLNRPKINRTNPPYFSSQFGLPPARPHIPEAYTFLKWDFIFPDAPGQFFFYFFYYFIFFGQLWFSQRKLFLKYTRISPDPKWQLEYHLMSARFLLCFLFFPHWFLEALLTRQVKFTLMVYLLINVYLFFPYLSLFLQAIRSWE